MSKQAKTFTTIPAAACKQCGGWMSSSGMSQHAKAVAPVLGRTGCHCNDPELRFEIAKRLTERVQRSVRREVQADFGLIKR